MRTTRTTRAEPAAPVPTAPDPSAIAADLRALAGRRVAVALSGGVDSAVAALDLVEAGADVVGISLRLHDVAIDEPGAPRACCAPDDLQDARRVAEALRVPFYVIDARESFEAGVVKPFVDSYLNGRTPNPCVGCNSYVKLGLLARRARALGAEALATGHYARLAFGPRLFRAADLGKDQSYFLFGTHRDVLSMLVLPLGAAHKKDVRERALAAGLPVAHKLDSQEVCFVGGAGAGAYVESRPEAGGDRSGKIVDASGEVLGAHGGIERFTVGQRRGLGLGTHRKLFVLGIEADSSTVVVGEGDALLKRGLRARRASWIGEPPSGPIEVSAKIRYRDPGTPAVVTRAGEDGVEVHFERPVRAVAPGQAVVFYRGDEVLGGAWIEEAIG